MTNDPHVIKWENGTPGFDQLSEVIGDRIMDILIDCPLDLAGRRRLVGNFKVYIDTMAQSIATACSNIQRPRGAQWLPDSVTGEPRYEVLDMERENWREVVGFHAGMIHHESGRTAESYVTDSSWRPIDSYWAKPASLQGQRRGH